VNRADLVAAAVEHLLPTQRLLPFGDLVAAAAPGHELVAVLASYQPAEVVTGGGRIHRRTGHPQGIHSTSLHGDRSSSNEARSHHLTNRAALLDTLVADIVDTRGDRSP
jgi:hypothetical protein